MNWDEYRFILGKNFCPKCAEARRKAPLKTSEGKLNGWDREVQKVLIDKKGF